MRRILLGAFLFLAACGGGLKGESPQVADPGADARAERAQLVMSAAGQQALADIARTACVRRRLRPSVRMAPRGSEPAGTEKFGPAAPSSSQIGSSSQ